MDLEGGWVRLEPGTTKNAEGRAFPLRGFPELDAMLKKQRERTENELQRNRPRDPVPFL